MSDLKEELQIVAKELKQEKMLVDSSVDTNKTNSLIDSKKDDVLNSEEAQKLAIRIAQEEAHSEFEERATQIEEQNITNDETHFDNKKRRRTLDRKEAEEELEHRYKMKMIKSNSKHKKMLDKRKKLVEKYGYLYSYKEVTTAFDSEDKEYQVPKDFSFSTTINIIRTFIRNIDRLDTAVKKILKICIFLGLGIAVYIILKNTGILTLLA